MVGSLVLQKHDEKILRDDQKAAPVINSETRKDGVTLGISQFVDCPIVEIIRDASHTILAMTKDAHDRKMPRSA